MANCKYCEKKFEKKQHKQLYCNINCGDRYRYWNCAKSKRLKNICICCGKSYEPYLKKQSLYCNSNCRAKYNRKIRRQHYNDKRIEYYYKNREKELIRRMVQSDKKKNPHLYSNECCICSETKNIQQHHPLYSFPYNVYPLCTQHHAEIHKNDKVIANE